MKVDAIRKIGYSFIGLLAGNIALLIALIVVSVLQRYSIPRIFPQAWQLNLRDVLPVFTIVATVSLLGWAVIGIPVVLALPARTARLFSWWSYSPLGLVLGRSRFFSCCWPSTGAEWIR